MLQRNPTSPSAENSRRSALMLTAEMAVNKSAAFNKNESSTHRLMILNGDHSSRRASTKKHRDMATGMLDLKEEVTTMTNFNTGLVASPTAISVNRRY